MVVMDVRFCSPLIHIHIANILLSYYRSWIIKENREKAKKTKKRKEKPRQFI
jgi:phosphate/sulfate permease